MHPLGSIGRYRPNKVASAKATNVKEYLIDIEPENIRPASSQKPAARLGALM
jgi:adenine-specific DNA-methyltransferase